MRKEVIRVKWLIRLITVNNFTMVIAFITLTAWLLNLITLITRW